ncbi:MAG: hypothetical protein AAF550_02090, partial [Myxococcota bacterium]
QRQRLPKNATVAYVERFDARAHYRRPPIYDCEYDPRSRIQLDQQMHLRPQENTYVFEGSICALDRQSDALLEEATEYHAGLQEHPASIMPCSLSVRLPPMRTLAQTTLPARPSLEHLDYETETISVRLLQVVPPRTRPTK